MSRKMQQLAAVVGAAVVAGLAGTNVKAATITRADNADALNLGSAWVDTDDGDVVPGASDIAHWDSTVASGVSSLGADTTWGQIRVSTGTGTIQISAVGGYTLTLNGVDTGSGVVGIDLSEATRALTIHAHGGVILGAEQTWNVAATRQILVTNGSGSVGNGTVTSNGHRLIKDGDGTLLAGTIGAGALGGDLTIKAGTVGIAQGVGGDVDVHATGILEFVTNNGTHAMRGLSGSGLARANNGNGGSVTLRLAPQLGDVYVFDGSMTNGTHATNPRSLGLVVDGGVDPSPGDALGVQVFTGNLSFGGSGAAGPGGSGGAYVRRAVVLVNGTATNLGASSTVVSNLAFVVGSHGVLGGTGTIGLAPEREFRLGDNLLTTRGMLSPGDSRDGENPIGTLTIGTVGNNNLVNFRAGGLLIEIDGATSDRLVVNGDLNLASSTDFASLLEVSILGTPTLTSYTIVTYTGRLTGQFEDISSVTSLGFSLDYNTAGQINLITVPEPSGIALLAGVGTLLMACRRP